MEGVETTEDAIPSAEEVEKWKRNDVTNFLNDMQEVLDLDNEDIQIIAEQKISGTAFLRLTAEKLMQDGLKRGPAETIAELIETIRGEEQGN